jgi:hypothetical protein
MNGRPTALGEGLQYAAAHALFEREQGCVSTFCETMPLLRMLITPVSDNRFWHVRDIPTDAADVCS